METILRKYGWALDLVVLVAAAVAVAHATAHVADAALLRLASDVVEELGPPPAAAGPAPGPDRRDEIITRRNIFCSACRAPTPAGVEDAAPAGAPSLSLLAIMYAPPPAGARWSVAVVRDGHGGSGAYPVGSSIGDAVVDAIDDLRVHLRLSDGRRFTLTLLEQSAAPGPLPPVDPLAAEMDAGIRKIAENRYDVSRSTIETLLGKMDALAPPAHLDPDVREGKPVGFRLRDVRPGGPFARIGLRDGDVISSVNGLATNGPDNALAIYASLRSVSHLSVALERNGRRISAEYDIE